MLVEKKATMQLQLPGPYNDVTFGLEPSEKVGWNRDLRVN